METIDGVTAGFGIGVSDLARSADFYGRVLGMKTLQTFSLPYMDEIVLGYEGKSAAVILMHYTDGSAQHYADNPVKIVFYVPDPQAVLERVRAAGYRVDREAEPNAAMGGALIGFAKDPDGYLVELIQRRQR